MTDASIFKAYDIRGLYPEELDEKTARALGRAVVEFSRAGFAESGPAKTVVVGRDCRLSSPELSAELIRGIEGVDGRVVDIGLASTPLFNFSVANYPEHDFGVMVSASHNPARYNGFKLTDGRGLPVGKDTGMEKIKELTLNFLKTPASAGPPPRAAKKDFSRDYLDKIFSFIAPEKIKPMKVVIDTANAMGGLLIEKIMARLPQIQPVYLFKEMDGGFPNHEANPLKTETLSFLRKAVKENGADIGVAYDGDADRIGFVDENGEPAPGDFLTAILAEPVLSRKRGALILGDVRFSRAARERIEEKGGRFRFCPVGHALIKKKMRDLEADFAGELSLHFYYRDFFNAESGDLTMLYILELLSRTGGRFSEIIRPLKKYRQSGEINFTATDKEKILAVLRDKYRPAAKSFLDIDGFRFDFDDWWFNVRASNTEPLLRLNLEAKTEEMMGERVEEVTETIESI